MPYWCALSIHVHSSMKHSIRPFQVLENVSRWHEEEILFHYFMRSQNGQTFECELDMPVRRHWKPVSTWTVGHSWHICILHLVPVILVDLLFAEDIGLQHP
ncbi:hypothetical protein SCLCIDRAFT_1224863 [Scleroderma citrinum Foug A]|uniref:Uncharacterized protein n=1 Tax=Scleroderma citrinum Foug A TaxID=1036808 RepID=A0A0C3D3Z7_9AGAM|nr:hypothetical protein SCLCIDRAFT_1224863 [Scleroderma citrinum Foug A]